jgi:hypothetical protein
MPQTKSHTGVDLWYAHGVYRVATFSAADALLGMVNIDLPLLLCPL